MTRIRIFNFFIEIAWWAVPKDWVWYASGSLERSIYEAVRRASIDAERLIDRNKYDRTAALGSRGTQQ